MLNLLSGIYAEIFEAEISANNSQMIRKKKNLYLYQYSYGYAPAHSHMHTPVTLSYVTESMFKTASKC